MSENEWRSARRRRPISDTPSFPARVDSDVAGTVTVDRSSFGSRGAVEFACMPRVRRPVERGDRAISPRIASVRVSSPRAAERSDITVASSSAARQVCSALVLRPFRRLSMRRLFACLSSAPSSASEIFVRRSLSRPQTPRSRRCRTCAAVARAVRGGSPAATPPDERAR